MLLLIGGTGFLGDPVVEFLMERECSIRLLTRGAGDWKKSNLSQYRRRGIDVVVGSLENDDVLERAVDGVDTIVNISGSFRLGGAGVGSSSYEFLNVELVHRLLVLAKRNEIKRFIQVSCLGAREESESFYLSSKSEGDGLVMASDLTWTVLRPSYMFGSRFPFVEMIRPLVTFKPMLPIVGSGLNVMRPLHVDDVAHCVVESLFKAETHGRVIDLVGPQEYSLAELLEEIRDEFGLGGPIMTIPTHLSARAFEMATKILPRNTITLELAHILAADSTSDSREARSLFKLKGRYLEDYLPEIVNGMKENKDKKK